MFREVNYIYFHYINHDSVFLDNWKAQILNLQLNIVRQAKKTYKGYLKWKMYFMAYSHITTCGNTPTIQIYKSEASEAVFSLLLQTEEKSYRKKTVSLYANQNYQKRGSNEVFLLYFLTWENYFISVCTEEQKLDKHLLLDSQQLGITP